MSPAPREPRDVLIYPLAVLVAVGWFASLVDALVWQQTVALKWTTPSLVIVLGYVFGVQVVRSARGNGSDRP